MRLGLSTKLTQAGIAAGAGGAFSPSDIANLELWLDASDAATINFGVNPAISSWEDKSGNSNTVSQGIASLQPVLTTGGLNGLDVVTFDGVDDHLISSVFANSPLVQPTTIYALFNSKNDTASLLYVFDGITATDRHAAIISNNNQQMHGGATLGHAHYGLGVSLYKYDFNNPSPAGLYEKHDVQLNSGNIGTQDLTAIILGARYTAAGNLNYDLCEFLIYNKLMTAQENSDVVTYLQEKWMPKAEPDSISGLVCWLDANEGLTLDGANVDAWADQSGNGNNATSTPGTEPQYSATGFNGFPTITFTGGDFFQIADSADLDSSTGYDCFIVLNRTAASAAQSILRSRPLGALGDPALHNGIAFCEVDSADRYIIGVEDDSQEYRFVVSNTGEDIVDGLDVIYNFNTDLENIEVEHNGVDQNMTTDQKSAGSVGTVTADNDLFIGREPGGTRQFAGQISEILIYNTQLSASDRNKVTNYLKFKWGV